MGDTVQNKKRISSRSRSVKGRRFYSHPLPSSWAGLGGGGRVRYVSPKVAHPGVDPTSFCGSAAASAFEEDACPAPVSSLPGSPMFSLSHAFSLSLCSAPCHRCLFRKLSKPAKKKKKKKDSSIDRDRRSGPGGGEGRYTRGLWKPSEVVGRPTKRGPLPRRLRLTHHTATLEGNLGLLGGALVTSRSDGGPVTTKQIHKICCAGGRTTPSKCLPSPYRSSAIRTNPTYPPPPPLSAVYFGSQRSKLSRLFVVGTRLTRRAVAGTGGSRLGISGGEGAD